MSSSSTETTPVVALPFPTLLPASAFGGAGVGLGAGAAGEGAGAAGVVETSAGVAALSCAGGFALRLLFGLPCTCSLPFALRFGAAAGPLEEGAPCEAACHAVWTSVVSPVFWKWAFSVLHRIAGAGGELELPCKRSPAASLSTPEVNAKRLRVTRFRPNASEPPNR